MLVEELLAHDQVRRDVLAVGPQVGFVDEDLAAAFGDETRRPRFGHPGTVDVARLELVERLRVLLRDDRNVAAARGVGLVPLVLQPRAQRDVLGVAELRRRKLLAREVCGTGDLRLHDEVCAARCRTGHDPDLAVRLCERVDGRVGTDEGRVERPGQDRGHGFGTGVEGLCLELVLPERVCEVAAFDADQRRCVRHVREVAEVHGDRVGTGGRLGCTGRGGLARTGGVVVIVVTSARGQHQGRHGQECKEDE